MDIRVNAKTILKVLAVWFHNTNQRLPTRKAFIIEAAFAALTDFYWKIRKEPQGISKKQLKVIFLQTKGLVNEYDPRERKWEIQIPAQSTQWLCMKWRNRMHLPESVFYLAGFL